MIWTEQQIRRALDGTFTSIRATADGLRTVTQKKPKTFIPDFSANEVPKSYHVSRAPRRKWTLPEVETAWEMWRGGSSMADIAEALSRNVHAVNKKVQIIRQARGWA